MNDDSIEPSLAVFEKLVGQEFSVQSGDQLIRLTLTEVTKLPAAATRTDLGRRQDPFVLLFKEVTDFQPVQNTYTAKTVAGTVVLFLVPVGFGEYEAVFN